MSFLTAHTGDPDPDKELADRYRQTGDLEVLGRLYGRYMDLVYAVCFKYFKDSERSRDAVMQIFEELVGKLRKHEVEHFRGWLHQVARNHCLMQLRSPKNLRTVEFNPDAVQNGPETHPEDVLQRETDLRIMEECLEQLGTEQQRTVRLFYLENKCYNEIAEDTGLEWNQVRSFIQNGRRNLRNCMEKIMKQEELG